MEYTSSWNIQTAEVIIETLTEPIHILTKKEVTPSKQLNPFHTMQITESQFYSVWGSQKYKGSEF